MKGRGVTLRRFGWSDTSAADAQTQAELRVTEAAQRAASGETVPRRDLKRTYNGAQGLPIREEVLARHGEAVITRNAYGARWRLIATHSRFTADDAQTQDFFKAVGADPIYARMCLNQHCFRARLSAKPWRIGIPDHLKPRPGVWPIRPERLPAREAWVRRYEREAEGYAACRYLETLGNGREDPSLLAIVALHDEESKALDDMRALA